MYFFFSKCVSLTGTAMSTRREGDWEGERPREREGYVRKREGYII